MEGGAGRDGGVEGEGGGRAGRAGTMEGMLGGEARRSGSAAEALRGATSHVRSGEAATAGRASTSECGAAAAPRARGRGVTSEQRTPGGRPATAESLGGARAAGEWKSAGDERAQGDWDPEVEGAEWDDGDVREEEVMLCMGAEGERPGEDRGQQSVVAAERRNWGADSEGASGEVCLDFLKFLFFFAIPSLAADVCWHRLPPANQIPSHHSLTCLSGNTKCAGIILL
jgi:hypothetical protein